MRLLRSHRIFFLLFGIGAACAAPRSIPPLEVEYAGCEALFEPGSVCVLPSERRLRLWVGSAPGMQIEVRAGSQRIDTAGEPVQDGQRFSWVVPPGAKRVDVLLEAREGRAIWSLSLAERGGAETPKISRDMIQEIAETARPLYNLIQDRQFIAARETLNGLRLTPKAPAEFRYHVAYNHGLLAEKEGDYRSAMAEIHKAVEIAERVKEDRYRWLAEQKLALLLCGVGRCRESAAVFDRLQRTPLAADSCDGGQLLINQGWSALLAREAGEGFADPAPLLERALEVYSACEHAEVEQKANLLINLALAHLQEGRLPQAKDALTRARELEPHPPLLQTLWWGDLEARITLQEERPVEALRLFSELEKLARETSSFDGRLRAAFGQARSYQALGDWAAALAVLRQAEALLDRQSLQIPVHEGRANFVATRQAIASLHIQILLDQGWNAKALEVARQARSRVLRQLEHGERLASLTAERRAQWERFLMEYQKRRTSLQDRAKADWRLPADQLRHERAVRREEADAANRLLDQAFLVLGDLGKQPREAPPRPPRPGELILAYHRLSRGWVGFAADGKTVVAHRFELPLEVRSLPAADLSRRLLLPFRAAILKAHRIRVLSSGRLQGVDFHELPFNRDVLLARVPVVYGLDLPESAEPAQAPRRHSLLVTDPRGDLPGALGEARTVRKVLESGPRPWTTEELRSAEASSEAVQGRLAAADLLHYAGHGTFSGLGGWESSLLLAEESQLTLGDLLALERVPAWVVLSACDAGRSSVETPIESLGLAHAFLLAGSREVVASTRPAADRTVPAFFAELYWQWDRDPDLAVALQRAQLAWRKQNPRADWAGFRLFEP